MVKEDGQPEPSYQYLSPNLMERYPNIYSSSLKYLQLYTQIFTAPQPNIYTHTFFALSHKCHRCDGPEVVELFANDAGEGGPHHGAGQGQLADPGRPQVDVLRTLIQLGVAFH